MGNIDENEDSEWVQDPRGFFTIKPFFGDKKVFVRHYTNDMKLRNLFSGSSVDEIMDQILSNELVSRDDHKEYLIKEIGKAFTALHEKIEYVQDGLLDHSKKVSEDKLNECYVEK
jgi:tetrahydromethanopterin S-methyltransferase subunit A